MNHRNKGVALLFGALLIAGATAYGVVQMMVSVGQNRVVVAPAVVPVVVASYDLPMGIPIRTEDIEVREVLAAGVPDDVTFEQLEEVIGRTPRRSVLAGEWVRDERLANASAGRGLNALIVPGKRAITVQANTETGLAGLLDPGNFVDIVVTISPDEEVEGTDARWFSGTILQNVRILAVDQHVDRTGAMQATSKSKQRPSVTVELLPEEVEVLSLAKARGQLTLSLRSDVDITAWQSDGPQSTLDMLGLAQKKTEARIALASMQANRPEQVWEVVQGGHVDQYTYDPEDGSVTPR